MEWRAITAANIQGRFTATENALLQATSGAGNKLQERLADAIGCFIGGMTAAGYSVVKTGLVPDQLRDHVMAKAVWEWLRDFPSLKVFKTAERLAAYQEAEKAYLLIVKKEYGALEPPGGIDTTGNWNSENKIIGRMHPIPPPLMQFQPAGLAGDPYANPNAVNDEVDNVSLPSVPVNFNVYQYEGVVTLTWVAGANGTTAVYNIFRGTTPNGESLTPVAAGVTGTSWVDATAVVGTTYYYILQAQVGSLLSPLTGEISILVDGGLQ